MNKFYGKGAGYALLFALGFTLVACTAEAFVLKDTPKDLITITHEYTPENLIDKLYECDSNVVPEVKPGQIIVYYVRNPKTNECEPKVVTK